MAVNNAAGPNTITFAPTLAGQAIFLTQQLPLIVQDYTTVTGLTTPDGQPNITIDASRVTIARATIFVTASNFTMTGIRLTNIASTNSALQFNAGAMLAFGAAPQTVSNITVNGNVFSNEGITATATGIAVSTDPGAAGATIKNVVISGNTFIHFQGDGDGVKVQAGGSNCLIQDVLISNNTFSQTTFPVELVPFNGQNSQIQRIQIVRNTFTDNHQAISIGTIGDNNSPLTSSDAIKDTLISMNLFAKNAGQSIALNGGFVNAAGNLILNTQIVNNSIDYTGASGALYVTGGASGSSFNRVDGVSIVNNTIVSRDQDGQAIDVITNEGVGNSVTGIAVLNTIFSGINKIQGVSPAQVSYSIVSPSSVGFAGVNGNLGTDPEFVDPTNGDFHLQPGSPAIGAGSATGVPTQDLECRSRADSPDIGAFEYNGGTPNCSSQQPYYLWISGPTSLSSGAAATYSATVAYGDGTLGPAAATWNASGGAATINATSGLLTVNQINTKQTVTLTASFSTADGTTTATLPIEIGTAVLRDIRTYIPAAMAGSGYTSYIRIINAYGTATPVSVALIDGTTGAVGTSGQLTTSLPAGAAVTYSAQQIEAALGVTLSVGDRPRLRVTSTGPVEVQSFQSNPTGVVVENHDAMTGASSYYVPSYIPAALAGSGYYSFVRIINVGKTATAINVQVVDGNTGVAGVSGQLTPSLAAGAAVTFTAQQIEAALGVALDPGGRPQIIVSGSVPLEVQSFQSNPGGAVTENGNVRAGTSVPVQNYIPAALSVVGYTSFIRVINSGTQPTSVGALLIDANTGQTKASGQLTSALPQNAAVTFSAQQIEAALGVVLDAQDRPRILVTSPSNSLNVQSFQSNPGGVVTHNSETRSGTSIDVRNYIPGAMAASGYASYIRFINMSSTATPVSVALIDGTTGVVGTSQQLTASLPAGGAVTYSASQIETALGGPLAAGLRPRIRVTATVPIEVQSFQSSPTGVVTENGGAQ